MPKRITKTQRWLDLIALLLNRQIPLGVDEIMERVPAYAQDTTTADASGSTSEGCSIAAAAPPESSGFVLLGAVLALRRWTRRRGARVCSRSGAFHE